MEMVQSNSSVPIFHSQAPRMEVSVWNSLIILTHRWMKEVLYPDLCPSSGGGSVSSRKHSREEISNALGAMCLAEVVGVGLQQSRGGIFKQEAPAVLFLGRQGHAASYLERTVQQTRVEPEWF